MIYELRTYTCLPGMRPKMVELLRGLMPVRERAGIETVGVWTNLIGRGQLIRALLRYESLADREQKWKKYAADPELHRLDAEYGPLVTYEDSEIMRPTDYSPLLK